MYICNLWFHKDNKIKTGICKFCYVERCYEEDLQSQQILLERLDHSVCNWDDCTAQPNIISSSLKKATFFGFFFGHDLPAFQGKFYTKTELEIIFEFWKFLLHDWPFDSLFSRYNQLPGGTRKFLWLLQKFSPTLVCFKIFLSFFVRERARESYCSLLTEVWRDVPRRISKPNRSC